MHRVVTALSAQARLDSASAFIHDHAGQEVLLISLTRTAADEFVRSICKKTGGVFGVHRFTLPQLGFDLATEPLADAGKTFIAGVGLEAMAARAIHACRTAGTLNWFDKVATTPGFFRALASTISAFGSETLTTAITPRMIQRYAIARKKDKCKIKGTPLANATVNRDLAALKHMLHKAEIWVMWRSRPDDAWRIFVTMDPFAPITTRRSNSSYSFRLRWRRAERIH